MTTSVSGSTRSAALVRTGTLLAAAACAVALVGCGPNGNAASSEATPASASTVVCQHVDSVHFDKTKFVLHAGLAFGAFHHFIYNPFRAGAFKAGAHGRLGSLVKAALASVFVVHELRLAKADAESSPTLCHLVAPLDEAASALSGLTSKLHSGNVSEADINGVADKINTTQQGSAQAGVPVQDQVPTDTQLANPGT